MCVKNAKRTLRRKHIPVLMRRKLTTTMKHCVIVVRNVNTIVAWKSNTFDPLGSNRHLDGFKVKRRGDSNLPHM